MQKKKSNVIQNVGISSEAFMYVMENRRNNREPFYKVLDRILEQHKKLRPLPP